MENEKQDSPLGATPEEKEMMRAVSPKERSTGKLVGGAAILVLILVVLVLWGLRQAGNTPEVGTPEFRAREQDQATLDLRAQSDSDEPDDILADVDNTDLDSLDEGSEDVETELETETQMETQ